MPGLSREEQRRVETEMDSAVLKLEIAMRSSGSDAVAAGVAEWAMRRLLKAGHLDEPRVIVRRAERKRR